MILGLTAAVIFGLAWRWLDHQVHPKAVACVPLEYKFKIDRLEAYINSVLGSVLEEAAFRWWLVLFSGTELLCFAALSTIVFQALHRCPTPWFYTVFGAVLVVFLLTWGWQASLVAHLAFNLSGALYIAIRCRQHSEVPVSCSGNH